MLEFFCMLYSILFTTPNPHETHCDPVDKEQLYRVAGATTGNVYESSYCLSITHDLITNHPIPVTITPYTNILHIYTRLNMQQVSRY